MVGLVLAKVDPFSIHSERGQIAGGDAAVVIVKLDAKEPRLAGVATSTSITPSRILQVFHDRCPAIEKNGLAPQVIGDFGFRLQIPARGECAAATRSSRTRTSCRFMALLSARTTL